MDETVFHIGDKIHGQIVRRIRTGIFGDTYFSIDEVLLDTGHKIAVGFYEGVTWRPPQGHNFVATVDSSTFSEEPYTLKSCLELKNVMSEPEPVQSIPEAAPIRRSPIAWLGDVCRKAFRCET